MNARLILDHPTERWRMCQDSEYSLPAMRRLWVARTEPDGVRGMVWLTDEESTRLLSQATKQ